MPFIQRVPDWYYGPWQFELLVWSENVYPWLIENDQADWIPHIAPITADWTPSTSPITPDWTPRDIPIS